MDEMQIRGLAMMLVIALVVLLLALRRQTRGIWLFALALIAVGLGYLATTPAPKEFATAIFGQADTSRLPAGTAKPAQ